MEAIELKKRSGVSNKTTKKVVELLNYAREQTKHKWVKSKDFFSFYDEKTKEIKPITLKFNLSASYGKKLFSEYKIFKFRVIDKEEYLQWNEGTIIDNVAINLHTDVYNYKLKNAADKLKSKAIAIANAEKKEAEQKEIPFPENNEIVSKESECVNQEETSENNYNTIILSLLETNNTLLETNKTMIENINKLIVELNKK